MEPSGEDINAARRILEENSERVHRALYDILRTKYRVHSLEDQWGVSAETILEAISRSPDLSQRGVRGLIAEAVFKVAVVDHLEDWADETPPGNHPYDFLLHKDGKRVRIQVKLQRMQSGSHMFAKKAYSFLSPKKFVAETQRSRRGQHAATGQDTRPYRFGEFDILAVCLAPATGDWTRFMYAPEPWLLPRQDDASLILKFQPVPAEPDDDWTDDLLICIERLHSGLQKRIKP